MHPLTIWKCIPLLAVWLQLNYILPWGGQERSCLCSRAQWDAVAERDRQRQTVNACNLNEGSQGREGVGKGWGRGLNRRGNKQQRGIRSVCLSPTKAPSSPQSGRTIQERTSPEPLLPPGAHTLKPQCWHFRNFDNQICLQDLDGKGLLLWFRGGGRDDEFELFRGTKSKIAFECQISAHVGRCKKDGKWI